MAYDNFRVDIAEFGSDMIEDSPLGAYIYFGGNYGPFIAGASNTFDSNIESISDNGGSSLVKSLEE